MPNTHKKRKQLTPDEIARLAQDGKDITKYFKKGTMKPPIKEVQIDQNKKHRKAT